MAPTKKIFVSKYPSPVPSPYDVKTHEEHLALCDRLRTPIHYGWFSYSEALSTRSVEKVVKSTTFSGIIPKIIVTPPSSPKQKKGKNTPKVVRPRPAITFKQIRPKKKREFAFPPIVFARWQRAYWFEVDAEFRPHLYGEKLLKDMAAFKRAWIRGHNVVKKTPPPTYDGDLFSFPAQATSVKGSGATPRTPRTDTSQLRESWEHYVPASTPLTRSRDEWTQIANAMLSLRLKIESLEEARKPQPRDSYRNLLKEVARLHSEKLARALVKKPKVCKTYQAPIGCVSRPTPRTLLRPEYKRFEMEQPPSDQVELQCITAGDATLPQAPEPSEGLIRKPIVRRRLLNMASSSSDEVNPLTDTWISLSTEEWNSLQTEEEMYWEYELPYVALEKTNLPQVLPFLAHQYSHFDMEVQINLTGLAWARGMLIASWYYHDDQDAGYSAHRRTRASMIQRDHILINASIENSGVLKIPFASYMSALPLVSRKDFQNPGKLGTLIITPFNRLMVADGQISSIAFTVNVRFTAALMYGKTATSIGERPYVRKTVQMLPMLAIMAAQKILNSSDSDPNRDKPPYQGPGMLMVPHTTSNLAIGTNYVEHVQSLRLDAKGQTPHPDLQTDCLTWKSIAQRKGYVKTFGITRDMGALSRVPKACVEACPMLSLDNYSKYNFQAQTVYNFPPIAVISSLFGKWRGSILVEYEFICAPAHHLEVLVAFVPRELRDITYEEAVGCHHQVFKLRDGGPRSFEFEIPYVAPTPFWDRRFSTGVKVEEVDPPGKIHFFIRTKLVYTSVITKDIAVNIYMRAGDDFEVAVPVQPSIGLCFDPFGPHSNPHEIIVAKEGYTFYNVDSWASATNPTGNIAMARYGPGGQHVCQFNTKDGHQPDGSAYYTLDLQTFASEAIKHKFYGKWELVSQTYQIAPRRFVPLSVGDSHGFEYMCIAQSDLQILYLFYDISEQLPKRSPREFTLIKRSSPNYRYATVVTSASSYIDESYAKAWFMNRRDPDLLDAQRILRDFWKDTQLPVNFHMESGDELVDNVGADCPTRFSSQTSGSGSLLYGESFFSIKDLCRRWQPFVALELTVDFTRSQSVGVAAFKIPVLPAGLALNAQSNHGASLIRDGVIPIVNSFFRFYRGGIRFKFLFSVTSMADVTFWVQHRPDRRVGSDSITLLPKNAIDGIYCHNYASTVQCTAINPTLTIEVPYYLRGPMGLLQRPKFNECMDNEAFALGELVVGYTSFSSKNFGVATVPVSVLWSYGDDFSPYVPIGFPAMVTLSQFESVTTEEVGVPSVLQEYKHFEMEKEGEGILVKALTMIKGQKQPPPKPTTTEEENSDYETIREVLKPLRRRRLKKRSVSSQAKKKIVKPAVKKVKDTRSFLTRIFEYFSGIDTTELREHVTQMFEAGYSQFDLPGFLFSLATHVVHVIATPTMTHVWISFVALLVQMGLMAYDTMIGFIGSIRNILSCVGLAKKRSEAYTDDDSSISKIIVTLYTCIASVTDIQLGNIKPRVGDIGKMMKIFSLNCKNAQSVVFCLTKIIETFMMFGRNIVYYAKNVRSILKWHFLKPDIVDQYVHRASELLHPHSEERIMTRMDGYLDIDIAYEQGASLLRDSMKKGVDSKPLQVIIEYQRKLGSLRDRAARMGCGTSQRRQPYCVHVTGKPGVGKSQITVPTINALLETAAIEYSGQSTWHLQHGLRHWDGLYNQPALLKDELCPMNDATMMVEELCYFQMLMSCAPFIRPGAAIEDKGRVYAPEIVWINSNNAYPTMDCVREKKAIFRRFTSLWEADFTPEAQALVGNLTGDKAMDILKKHVNIDIDNFGHLRFRRKVNPADEECKSWGDWVPFKTFIKDLYLHFIDYRNNQFHLISLYMQKNIKIDLEPDQVEEVLSNRIVEQCGEAGARVIKEIKHNMYPEEVTARDPKSGKVTTANPMEVAEKMRQELRPMKPGLPSIKQSQAPPWQRVKRVSLKTRASSSGSEVDIPQNPDGLHPTVVCGLINDLALGQDQRSRRDLLGRALAKDRIEVTKIDWAAELKSVGPPEVEMSHPKQFNGCPHRYSVISHLFYDEHLDVYYSPSSKLEGLQTECNEGEHCIARDPIESVRVARRLRDNSRYWSSVLYTFPKLFPDNEVSKYISPGLLIRDLHLALDREMTWATKLRQLTKFFNYILPPLAAVGLLWGVSKIVEADCEAENQRRKATIETIRVMKAKQLSELNEKSSQISPAQYAGKTLNGNKKSGIVRRFPTPLQPLKVGETSCEVDVSVVDTCNYYGQTKQFEMQVDVVSNIVLNNTRFLVMSGYDDSGKVVRRQCRVLGVCDRYIIFPHHYIYEWQKMDYKDRTITVYHLGQFLEVEAFRWSDVHQIEGTDLVVYRLGPKFPSFKDIRPHLSTYDILEKGLSRKGQFFEVVPKIDAEKGQILNISPITMTHAEPQNVECNDMTVTLNDGIVYPEIHGAGKCGSVVVDTHNGKIVGMHVAGDSREGMSAFLVRDWFDEIQGVITPMSVADMNPEFIDLQARPKVFLEGTFIEGGLVSKEYEHRETGKTAILPSEIAGVYPVETAPAILSDKDPRALGQSPMKLGVEKHGKPFTNIPSEYSQQAIKDYRELVFAKVKPLVTPVEPLTIEQAIMGDKDLYPGLKPIEMHTSEGFPFIAKRPKGSSDKSWLFSFDEVDGKRKLVGIHNELDKVLTQKQLMREQGIRPATVFTDCLKDERKKISKIAPNKTRIFSISPVDYTIQCRQYFAPFFQAFEAAGLEMEHAIGIAVQREDWSSLVRHMLALRGSKPVAHACGDYTAFGDTLDAGLVEAALNMAIDWCEMYEQAHLPASQVMRNKTVRTCLAAELKNATHMTFNVLVEMMCGMPSGCPLTVYLNTMVNSMYLRCAWLDIMNRELPDIAFLDQFSKYVRVVTYGDDVWMTIDKEILDVFNNRSVSESFASMGITYTDIMKDGFIRTHCELGDVTFLKNNIIPHPTRQGMFLAALDTISILDCVNWIHKCTDERAASLEVSYSSTHLAYGRGPDFYNQHAEVLTKAWAAKGVAFQARPWSTLDDQFYREEIPLTYLAEFPIDGTPHSDRALLYARARAAYNKFKETCAN